MNYPLKSPGLASKDDLNNLIPFVDYTSSETDEIPSGSVYYVPYPCLIAFTMTSEVDRAFLYSISVNKKVVILETLGVGSQSCNTLILKGGEPIYWNSSGQATLSIRVFKLQNVSA